VARTKNKPPVRREPLSRTRLLQAAVAMADQTGVDSISMRKLAGELGVVPMALYKHVTDKDDLVNGMVDVVVGEFEAPPAGTDWKTGVRERILSARRTLLRHPWARQAIESRTKRTPTVLAYMDSIAGWFFAGGFSPDLTHHVMHVLGNRIWGFSPELFDDSRSAEEQAEATTVEEMAAKYPHIMQIVLAATGGDLASGQGCDEQFEFEFALDLLLDGFQRLHDTGWTSKD
jgi:AcrR family transcriptional regulator